MKDTLKIIRNVVIFGIVLYVINFILNFVADKLFSFFDLDSLYDINIILYAIITMGIGIIIYIIAMILTKKLISIKIKIYYEEAKKMLLILLILFLIITVGKCFISYNSSLKIEEELYNMIEKLEETKSSKEYKTVSKSTKDTFNSMYKMYVEGKDEILELENQKRTLIVVRLISDTFLYIACLYGFGLFLYRKE